MDLKNIKYYDTHSHINDVEFENEVFEVIEKLKSENILTNAIGCCLPSSIKAVELAKNNPSNVKACVGIHPNEVINYSGNEKVFEQLDKLVEQNLNHIVAIGEIGLDLFYDKSNLEQQIYFCKKQIEIAIKYNLPIMFHIRDAFEEIKPIILKYKNYKKIIHCFSTNYNQAEFYIENNCMISIPGIVTFKNAKELHEAVQKINIENLICETDAPYLTPVPDRGKKNYPSYVQYVYKEIAKIKNIDEKQLSETINNNAFKFFNLK